MTIQDMVCAGIELQGDDICILRYSYEEERYVYSKNLNEIPVDSQYLCTLDVKYIYADKLGRLCIELESC